MFQLLSVAVEGKCIFIKSTVNGLLEISISCLENTRGNHAKCYRAHLDLAGNAVEIV